MSTEGQSLENDLKKLVELGRSIKFFLIQECSWVFLLSTQEAVNNYSDFSQERMSLSLAWSMTLKDGNKKMSKRKSEPKHKKKL